MAQQAFTIFASLFKLHSIQGLNRTVPQYYSTGSVRSYGWLTIRQGYPTGRPMKRSCRIHGASTPGTKHGAAERGAAIKGIAKDGAADMRQRSMKQKCVEQHSMDQ